MPKETVATPVTQVQPDHMAQQDLKVIVVMMDYLAPLATMVLPEEMVLMESQERMESVDLLEYLAEMAPLDYKD